MKSIELFAGIGGIALAAEWAGIETVAFCEREPYCQKVLNKHWPDVPVFDDIKTLNREVLEGAGVIEPGGTIDIISGGFPCQPFSIAGKRKGKEDDRDLWPEMFRIIRELQPTWVIGENVANFVNMELERTLTDLENEGYETQTFIIPAASVNAKHQRYRTFIVAYSDSNRNISKEKCRTDRNRQTEMQKRDFSQFESCYDGDIFPNSNCKRLERSKDTREISREGQEWNEQFTRCGEAGTTWSVEPDVGRVAHGISNRVDRLKSLGNAVVPQQIYPIFKAIMEIEKGKLI